MSLSLIRQGDDYFSPDSLSLFLSELGSSLAATSRPPGEVFSWRPQPRQQQFLEACGVGEVLDGGPVKPPQARLIGYGGAAGGGKTDADLGLAAIMMLAIPGLKVGFFRRHFTELEGADGAIARSQALFAGIPGATYNDSKHVWSFPGGAKLHFCHCANEKDVYKYQSTQFGLLIIDEATHFTWFIVDYLTTRNRSTVSWPGLGGAFPFTVATTNPGNIGHHWYRQVFVDAGAPDTVHEVETPNGQAETTMFFPAKLEDNQILRDADPDYERKLESRDPDTVRMLRWGDWDVAAGLYFGRMWRSVPREGLPAHIIEDLPEIPRHWRLFGSVDYGFAPATPDEKPFVYGLYATDECHAYLIAEIAAAFWDPAKQIAEIKELEARYPNHRVEYRVGCPGMFIRKDTASPSIAEQYALGGVPLVTPHTDRVNGWARCLQWLNMAADGQPFFMSFRSCGHFNKIVPSLPQDIHRRDEIDRNAEDHPAEAWRHFLMSRPEPARPPAPKVPFNSSAGVLARVRRNAA